jgi:hypothetical protein
MTLQPFFLFLELYFNDLGFSRKVEAGSSDDVDLVNESAIFGANSSTFF